MSNGSFMDSSPGSNFTPASTAEIAILVTDIPLLRRESLSYENLLPLPLAIPRLRHAEQTPDPTQN